MNWDRVESWGMFAMMLSFCWGTATLAVAGLLTLIGVIPGWDDSTGGTITVIALTPLMLLMVTALMVMLAAGVWDTWKHVQHVEARRKKLEESQ